MNLREKTRKADIRDINRRYNEWAEKQFPDSTAISSLKGLKRECDECISDIEKLTPEVINSTDGGFDICFDAARIEYADCLMYLIDSARRFGLSLDDLFFALDEKLQINLSRDWKINEDKSYSHIKQ